GRRAATRGGRVAELQGGGAERPRGEPQPLGAARPPAALEPDAGREKEQEAERSVEVGRAHVVVEAVLEQHALDLEKPHEHAQLHGRATRVTVSRAAWRAARGGG